MRRKRLFTIIIMSIVVFLLGNRLYLQPKRPLFPYAEEIMGIYIVEDNILAGRERLVADENLGILFGETLLPYDAENNALYLPQSVKDTGWSGCLSVVMPNEEKEDFYLCAPDDELWHQKVDAIHENHKYTLWLIGEDAYFEYDLIVTGTPVIAIETERVEIPEWPDYEEDPDALYFGTEPLYYGTVAVFDPDMSGSDYIVTEARVCYHEKGMTASVFSKKSYSLDILDQREKSMNVSLLGMREDNSWKLNSLYGDVNRIREKTAAQIWENFDTAEADIHEPGPRMEYIELILDNQYQGLYCLVEPVDRKKLQLDTQDVLYKVIGWNIPDDAGIQYSIDKGWKIQAAIRIRFPKEIMDYAAVWQPIRSYHQLFYWSNELDYTDAIKAINIDNVIDYSLFIMAVSASDNAYKNMYLASYHSNEGYVTYLIPWDLDYSFGSVYTYEDFPVEFDSDVSLVYLNEVLMRLYTTNPQEVGQCVWEKWNEYRSTFLDTEVIWENTVSNYNYLKNTGAFGREKQRWPEANVDMDIEELLEYQKARLDWLDTYFYEWADVQ